MSRSRESRFQNPVTKAFAASRAGETRLRRLLFRPGTRFRVTFAIPWAAAASAFSSATQTSRSVNSAEKTSAGTLKGSPGCFTRVTRGPASPTRTTRVWSRCTMALKGTVGHHRGMKRTVVWLTGQQVKALAKMSRQSLVPVSALVRQAVKQFLETRRKYR